MTEDSIKLPRSSYEELTKIIRAYGRVNKPVSNQEISRLSGVSSTRISANNAFLTGIDVIDGKQKKAPTEKGLQLARALEHEIPAEVAVVWSKVVLDNDFLNKMVQAISVRRGMEISHLESHIAYSAGETKSKDVMTGSRAVIDILRASGLVTEDGDKIVPSKAKEAILQDGEEWKARSLGSPEDQSMQDVSTPASPSTVPLSNVGSVSIQIQIRINASPDDLGDLGEKLEALMRTLKNVTPR